MRYFATLAVAFVLSCSLFAADLPVPDELVGPDTIGLIHIDLGAIKLATISKTVADKTGTAPDAAALEKIQPLLDAFKSAGGTGFTLAVNVSKEADKTDPSDAVVLVLNKKEDADTAKLTELVNALVGPAKDKLDPKCPKEIGGSLVWHSAGFKLPKHDEARETAFTSAYANIAKGSTLSIVIVPDEDAAALAEAKVKESNPEEAKLVKALLGGDGFCIFTDFGSAADPSLKVLFLASDADEAKTVDGAVKGLLAEARKGAPPELEALLKTLNVVQAGSNLQLSIDFGELAKALKPFIPAP